MAGHNDISRRSTLKSMSALGAASLLGSMNAGEVFAGSAQELKSNDIRKTIFEQVSNTPFIDTHEHLIEEQGRLTGTAHKRVQSDDWSLLFHHYLNSDLITAGMPRETYDTFFSPEVDPIRKWKYLESYWPYVKNTGYGLAVRHCIRELYDVDEISTKTISRIQAGYEKVRRSGFYKYILQERANIESCQVNCLEGKPFMESSMPTFLMQDISIVGMFQGPNMDEFGKPTGIKVGSLYDWYRVIDWWFDKYGRYAVSAKSQNAYSRDINYKRVPEEAALGPFKKILSQETLKPEEQKDLEDHLFWYAVQKASEKNLPVKLHTGYYAGEDRMPLSRLLDNPASACELCRAAPDTRFVFMHIGYPYYEEFIAIAKQYTNAYIDMCWSWIINPIAAKDFVKKYLVTAPANKIMTFGGDYIPVEPVLGHSLIARKGIALALSELVEEDWLTIDDALALIDPIMHENARTIFNLGEKVRILKNAPWVKS